MAENKNRPHSTSFVDLTRFLDSGVLTLFTLLLSCTFLFMFGEMLKLLNNVNFTNDLLRKGLNRLFPFREFRIQAYTCFIIFIMCIATQFQES